MECMTRKQRRGVFITAGLTILGFAVFLVLFALSDSIVYFYSPSDIAEKHILPGQRIRLGGLVGEGSVKRDQATHVEFSITDGKTITRATYTGLLPDLFAENKGVVAEGKFDAAGVFRADTVLAKHDEKYMPREVADALKKQGVWQGEKESDAMQEHSASQIKGRLP
jgi:cytochrome c-type biogenesis protein CcmE